VTLSRSGSASVTPVWIFV